VRGWARALGRLFAPKGPFAAFPGAALCLDRRRHVLYANERAGEIASMLASGHEGLAAAVRRALEGAEPAAATLAPPATRATLAVTVLPAGGLRDGSASHALVLARDASLERNLRTALTDSRQRYKDLVEISSDFAWETGPDGTFAFVSPRGALGYRAEELVGCDPRALLAERDRDQVEDCFRTTVRREDVTVWARRADAGTACLLVSCQPIADESGAWRGARGVCRDVTEMKERDAALARARARETLLAYIIRQIRDEIVPQQMMKTAADAIAKALGATGCRLYRRAEDGFTVAAEFGTVPALPEAPLGELGEGAERQELEHGGWRVAAIATRYRRAVNGAVALWRDERGADWDHEDVVLLGEVSNQIGIAIEQVATQEDLERLSRTDTLTGLLNRRVFFEEVATAVARAARGGRPGALCYVDLDNFKQVNDRLGHQQGDKALVAVAAMLRETARTVDLVARLGGDEFAIWLEDTDAAGAAAKAQSILAAAQALKRYSGDADHPLGCSIGIAVHDPASPEGVEQLAARADEAMYEVKRAGKGRFHVAGPGAPAAAHETTRARAAG
jgi:diguanylate cyclase (GGDEF)-like protein/PAS domain S-box-containing protein